MCSESLRLALCRRWLIGRWAVPRAEWPCTLRKGTGMKGLAAGRVWPDGDGPVLSLSLGVRAGGWLCPVPQEGLIPLTFPVSPRLLLSSGPERARRGDSVSLRALPTAQTAGEKPSSELPWSGRWIWGSHPSTLRGPEPWMGRGDRGKLFGP